tara:strand:- start:29734 stop:30576 length:843 start_codon:yes stop_codon:yes gene_type:complete
MIPLIGTRKSKLALAYTNKAIKRLDISLTTVLIDSEADLKPDVTIEELGNKGVFSKEAETSLINNHIDIACHAYKDLTRDNDHLLEISCVLPRADFRDCLIGNNINPRTIGTSSPRRLFQLQELYPNAQIVPIRGNIDTRIQKQENGEYDAIVLAKAGLDSLNLTHKASRIFGTADMLPAPGQGVIALQTRIPNNDRDRDITGMLWARNHIDTWYTVMAEKAMLKEINGDCHTPIGVLSYVENNTLHMVAKHFETDKLSLNKGPIEEYNEIGSQLGKSLI